MKLFRAFILCSTLGILFGCTGKGGGSSASENDTLSVKGEGPHSGACLFDIREFEILDTTGESIIEKYVLDTVKHVITGKLKNGYHFQCKLFVCDSWGFNSTFKKRIDRASKVTLTVDSILNLFSVLPTTPDRDRFMRKISAAKDKLNLNIENGIQEINISDPEIGEFFVHVSKAGAVLKIDIDLNSYY